MTYAFKVIDKAYFHKLMNEQGDYAESNEIRLMYEKDMIYLGTFGLQDHLRSFIDNPIHLIKYGHSDKDKDSPT